MLHSLVGGHGFFDHPRSCRRWSCGRNPASLKFTEQSASRVLLMSAGPSNAPCLVSNPSRSTRCWFREPVLRRKCISRGHLFVCGNASAEATRIGLHGAAKSVHEKSSLVVRSVKANDKGYEEGVVVLVLGSGGREHALCYGLRRSASCTGVFCSPGNAGIMLSGDATCISDLDITNSPSIISFCKEWGVGLVVVGPEGPLVAGVVDDLLEAGIPTFGPSAEAAALEGSKSFMKRICDKYAIPTAKYGSFSDPKEAKDYIQQQELPIVVKADGLAAGKGVIIAHTVEEAFQAVDAMLIDRAFGSAGGLVVVEEFLEGEEVSFFAIVDGDNAVPLASAQDHKRVGDGDVGPNTGGMGAYSPAPILTPELQEIVMDSIILPTVKGMSAEGCKFVGVLFAGVIVESKTGSPKLLEYNVRFGDPECQVLMMRFRSDLVQLLLAACKGQLKGIELKWTDEPALVVVLASQGYPGDYKKGAVIENLEEADSYGSSVKLFHAGTALNSEQKVVAVGGRVLGVTAVGKDIVAAQEQAYQVVDSINWPEGFCRRDIGWRAVARFDNELQEKKQRHIDVGAYQVVDSINWPEGFCRRDIGWRAVARFDNELQEKKQRHIDVGVS